MAHKNHQSRARPGAKSRRREWWLYLAAGILALMLIVLAAGDITFLQDDAYISFRYVHNMLAGEGLVFNAGERVEGYTNFLWVILLALAVKLGFGLEEAARWLGLVFAGGTAAVTVFLARRIFAGKPFGWAAAGSLIAGFWVALNPAVRYWAGAGLETGMFLFFVTFAVERLVAGSPSGWWMLVLASLARPEGALIFAVAYAWHLARVRPNLKSRWWPPVALFVAPLVPFAVFKLMYYGSLLPNPFFAKTGFSPDYWQSGLEYLWLYCKHLALWGALPAVLVIGVVRAGWKSHLGLPALLWLAFALYIVSIGGDVLHAHRFFVPVWPIFSVAVLGGWYALTGNARRMIRIAGLIAAASIPLFLILIPGDYFNGSRRLEISLVRRMGSLAYWLQSTDRRPLTVAASTIGRLSYDLRNHIVIDMLGLVDSTVARHPERIDGLPASWKERHYNAGYVLSREPDYIIFSTDDRPSAPAEKALVLHSRFRRNYSTTIYPRQSSDEMFVVFKRTGLDPTDMLWPDPGMPDRLAEGIVTSMRVNGESGRRILYEVRLNGPDDFALPLQWIGQMYFAERNFPAALACFDSALMIDSSSVIPLYLKSVAYFLLNDSTALASVTPKLAHHAPWLTIP